MNDTIRVAASNLRALSHAHPGVRGIVKEVYANAEGYASVGVIPHCNAVLVDEDDADLAYLFFRSHSTIDKSDRVLDIGHLDDIDSQPATETSRHRKFNVGTYIVAGKLCDRNKEGMIVATFDPVARAGHVMRAYVGDEGYVCRVPPVPLALDEANKPTLFSTPQALRDRNRIEKLWLSTRWEVPLNIQESHANFCEMLDRVAIAHSFEGKKFVTTAFVYTHLKTVHDEEQQKRVCFLRSTSNDILDRVEGSSFRDALREHFLPHVNGMPLMPGPKKRLFQVMGVPVTLAPTHDVNAPWIAKVAQLLNDSSSNKWYALLGGAAHVKIAKLSEPLAKRVYDNFRSHSRSTISASAGALASGIVVSHIDKVLSKTPFGFYRGDCFQVTPETAAMYDSLVDCFLSDARIKEDHVDQLFALLGVNDAKNEVDMSLSDDQRSRQLSINAKILGIDDVTGYAHMTKMIVRPHRKARKVVDKVNLVIDETRVDKVYTRDPQLSSRLHYVSLLGLDAAAVLQVGGLEQPIDKERILDDEASRRLHAHVLRCLVHHDLHHPTSAVAALRTAMLDGWKQMTIDARREEDDVAWIKAEIVRREAETLQRRQRERQEADERELANGERLRLLDRMEQRALDAEARVVEKERETAEEDRRRARAQLERREVIRQRAESRRNEAERLFSAGVKGFLNEFGALARVYAGETFEVSKFRRSKSTAQTAKYNKTHQWIEAVGYAMDSSSLLGKRKLARWVTGDMAKAMVETLMSDDIIMSAIGARYVPPRSLRPRRETDTMVEEVD